MYEREEAEQEDNADPIHGSRRRANQVGRLGNEMLPDFFHAAGEHRVADGREDAPLRPAPDICETSLFSLSFGRFAAAAGDSLLLAHPLVAHGARLQEALSLPCRGACGRHCRRPLSAGCGMRLWDGSNTRRRSDAPSP